MSQNVGQSRGSSKHKQFVQDNADSFVVESFKDVSEIFREKRLEIFIIR